MKENFGARLKRLRTAAGLTKSELSRRAVVSREYIYQLEEVRPQTRPGLRVAQPLADVLGVYVGYLISGTEMAPVSRKRSDIDTIPIYSEFPLKSGARKSPAKIGFLYREHTVGRDTGYLDAYVVKGIDFTPLIDDGDCIVVDRKASIDDGDVVIYSIDKNIRIARLKKMVGELWLESNEGHYRLDDCGCCAVVIEVIKTVKAGHNTILP